MHACGYVQGPRHPVMPQQMTPEQIAAHFPRASKSTLAANAGNGVILPSVATSSEEKSAKVQKLRLGRQPNAKESEFGLILAAMKSRGDILHFAYEAISLRWGDGMRYTADWTVWPSDCGKIRLIEIKGRDKMVAGKVVSRRADAIVRFKGCMAEWKEYFVFEMHEKRGGVWSIIA